MYDGSCFGHREKGAITVFLALIFLSVVIFAGTIIDIVRIAAAERKVQSALNSSARSVLVGYDSELLGGYGIYGINAASETVKDDFYRYLSVNLKERHKGISFIDIEIERDDINIEGMESLLSDAAFKHQVQEYMKYRMPIAAADNIIEQLKNIKLDKKVEHAKGEKAVRDKASELRQKVNEVNERLAGIKRKLVNINAEKLEDIKEEFSDILTASTSIFSEPRGLIDDYNESRDAANAKAIEGECTENKSEEFANIIENSKSLIPVLNECISEVNRTLNKVGPMQEELEELEEELEDLETELEENDSDTDDLEEDVEDVRTRIRDMKSRIEDELEKLKARLQTLPLEEYILMDETVLLPGKNAEEYKSFIKQKQEEIAKLLLRRLERDWLISAVEFDESNLAVGDDFNIMDESVYSSSISENQAEEYNDKVIRSLEMLAEAVENAASGTMEKLSTVEYVMDKYTFLTSKTQRDHYFKKGEVEYIISGRDIEKEYDPIKNTEYYIVTKVLLQVWALRFAIDTIDNFARSVVVFPPQRLASALAEGALDSSLDMVNMLKGEEIPMCPKSFTAIRLKYSDHLKMLLLLKPEEEIMRKARQLMQVNIKNMIDARTGLPRRDFRMGDYSTAITASVEAKVNLFFLPMLKVDRLMPGSFEGGRYKIRKQIFMGY